MNLEACQPMSPGARLIHKIRHEDSNIGGDGGDNEGGGTQMYRLMATRGTRDVGRCGVSCLGGACYCNIFRIENGSHLLLACAFFFSNLFI